MHARLFTMSGGLLCAVLTGTALAAVPDPSPWVWPTPGEVAAATTELPPPPAAPRMPRATAGVRLMVVEPEIPPPCTATGPSRVRRASPRRQASVSSAGVSGGMSTASCAATICATALV